MKKYFVPVLLFLSIFAMSQNNDQQAVADLSLRKIDWLVHQQTDSLQMLLHDELLYIHSNGLVETKQEMLQNNQSGELTYISVKTDSLQVRMINSTAIVTGEGLFNGVINETRFEARLLFTEVYIRQNDAWKLISRHANQLR
jgi:hypothetical protein